MKCSNCGATVNPEAESCPECGAEFVAFDTPRVSAVVRRGWVGDYSGGAPIRILPSRNDWIPWTVGSPVRGGFLQCEMDANCCSNYIRAVRAYCSGSNRSTRHRQRL
ncbi:MAG: zinc ribbon domain-containing protein, partial [Halobacteriaceae archaeon]